MTTKTKTKPPGQSIAERATKERQEMMEAADQALLRLADGEPLTDADTILFVSLNWDDEKIARESGRAAGVRRWQGRAGTSDERSMAYEREANAVAELEAQGPDIEAEITKLQLRLQRLEAEAAEAAQVVRDQAAAVKALRELAPPFVAEVANRKKRRAKERLAPRQNQFETRLRVIQGVSSLPVMGEDVVRYAQKACPELLKRNAAKFPIGVDVDGWRLHCEELQAEAASIQPRFEEASAELMAALDEAELLKNFYCR
jgi:hypothetical protein